MEVMIKMAKKSNYRIVPVQNNMWSLKDGNTVIGTFISRPHAERKLTMLRKLEDENFLLEKTKNQELDDLFN
jgi:hypothetical protein